MNVEVLFSMIDILRSALTHFVHSVPFMSKGPAMWSLSILHVLLLTRYSAPTLTTRQWRNRLKEFRHLTTYVHLSVFSILTCGLCQDAVSPT